MITEGDHIRRNKLLQSAFVPGRSSVNSSRMITVLSLLIVIVGLTIPLNSPDNVISDPEMRLITGMEEETVRVTVMINEIHPDPDTDHNGDGYIDQLDEFIELFNPCDYDILLDGWSLEDPGRSFDLSGYKIDPGSFIALFRSQTSIVLGRDDVVVLKNDTGIEVDSISFSSIGSGAAVQRSPDGAERIRKVMIPTPGEPNMRPPDLLINEIMIDPLGSNIGRQWVELINKGDDEILEGFRLDNGESLDTPLPSVLIGSGERIIISLGFEDYLPPHPEDITIIELDLDKGFYVNGDNLEIRDPDGYCLDFVAWGASSHVDPPVGFGPGGNWSGKFWDKISSSMTTVGLPNIQIVEGSTISRWVDMGDTDSPEDWSETDTTMGNTAGWNNSHDPSLLVRFLEVERFMNLSERIDIAYEIINTGNLEGNQSINIVLETAGWTLISESEEIIMIKPGESHNGLISAISPSDLTFPNVGELILDVVNEDMDFIHIFDSSSLIIPGYDLSISDLSISDEGGHEVMFPQGSIGEIRGVIEGGGQLNCGEVDLLHIIRKSDGDRSVIFEGGLSFSNIGPTSRREFSILTDTMEMMGNYTIEIDLSGRDDDRELNFSNNHAQIDITVIPSTVPHGMRGLLISEILWNATTDERYLILENPSDQCIDIGFSMVSDGVNHASFPDGTTIDSRKRLGIAWGEFSAERIDDADRIYRMDPSGPTYLRMTVNDDIPDPAYTGRLSYMSRYRHDIDSIELKMASETVSGWLQGDSMVETTSGTVMFRIKDSAGNPIDTNSSLDWNVNRNDPYISSFMPRPGQDSIGEIIFLRSRSPGSDISGYTLTCGRYLATIPNGTHTDISGEIVISREPDSYLAINGFEPDLCTGWDIYINGDNVIPGCRISGYPELVQPDSGGSILLLDPGNRIIDRVSWGMGTAIDATPGNSLIGRTIDLDSSRSTWHLRGTGSTPDATRFNSAMNSANFTSFPGLIPAIEWIGTGGEITIWTSEIHNGEFLEKLIEYLEGGHNIKIIYLSPPWRELPDHLGGYTATMERLRAALDLFTMGADIYHIEDTPGSGPICFMLSGSRLAFSPFSPGSFIEELSLPPVFGYEFNSTKAPLEVIRLIAEDRSEKIVDSGKILDLMGDTIPDDTNIDPVVGSSQDIGKIVSYGKMLVSVTDPIGPFDTKSHDNDTLMFHSAGEIDFVSILKRLESGGRIRIMISAGSLKPYPGGNGSFYSSVEGRIGGDHHMLSLGLLREDLLVRSAAAVKIASDRGLDLEVRLSPPSFLSSVGGNIIINDGSSSIGYCRGDDHFLSRMITARPFGAPIDIMEIEELWSSSMELPVYLSGFRTYDNNMTEPTVRIREVYYDTYIPDDPDEYVAISNYGSEAVDLSGFTISDDEGSGLSSDGTVIMGPGLLIHPGETQYISMNGISFTEQNGFIPDASWNDGVSWSGVHLTSGFMRLGNGNDSVCLRDNLGRVVDVLPYGSAFWIDERWQSFESGRWSGDSVPDIGWGRILKRNGPVGKEIIRDTNSALDWIAPRPYYPGQSDLPDFDGNQAESARVGICPDSSTPILQDIIDSAGSDLLVNVYEITSEWITSALIGARSRGVDVRLILEGSPVGGMSYSQKYCLNRLNGSGARIRIMTTDIENGIRDRYRYDHAKYIVSDGREIFVSSDNFKDSSFPRYEIRSHSGTRGWVASIRSVDASTDLTSVFEADWNGPDMIPWIEVDGIDPGLFAPDKLIDGSDESSEPLSDLSVDDIESVEILVSPDHLGSADNGLMDSIRSAETEILLELMDIKEHFDTPIAEIISPFTMNDVRMIYPGRITANPYLRELFSAAERGVSVKLLLDGSDFNGDSIPDNSYVCDWINEMARKNGCGDQLTARLHPGPRYLLGHEVSMIHNKGMIVDGCEVWISSFNWGPTSAAENREVGVLVSSEDAAGFFRGAFMLDWGATLISQVNIRTGHLLCEPFEKGLIEYSLDISVNMSMLDRSELLVMDLDDMDLLGFDGEMDTIDEMMLEGGEIHHRDLKWIGDDSSNYVIFFKAEERVMPVLIVEGSAVSDERMEIWSYPWYREPAIPIIIILIISIGISVVLSALRKAGTEVKPDIADGSIEE